MANRRRRSGSFDDAARGTKTEGDEGDQKICPKGNSLDLVRQVTLQSQPDESLDHLVGAENQRQRGQRDVMVAP